MLDAGRRGREQGGVSTLVRETGQQEQMFIVTKTQLFSMNIENAQRDRGITHTEQRREKANDE